METSDAAKKLSAIIGKLMKSEANAFPEVLRHILKNFIADITPNNRPFHAVNQWNSL